MNRAINLSLASVLALSASGIVQNANAVVLDANSLSAAYSVTGTTTYGGTQTDIDAGDRTSVSPTVTNNREIRSFVFFELDAASISDAALPLSFVSLGLNLTSIDNAGGNLGNFGISYLGIQPSVVSQSVAWNLTAVETATDVLTPTSTLGAYSTDFNLVASDIAAASVGEFAVFSFLVPGGPEIPDTLAAQEYRFSNILTDNTLTFQQPPPAPEPSSILLLALGVLGLARHTQRRRRKA